MSLKEIFEVAGYVAVGGVGIWVSALALNESIKRYVSWADKNKFYDKGPKFSDLEKKGPSNFDPQELIKMQYQKYASSVSLS